MFLWPSLLLILILLLSAKDYRLFAVKVEAAKLIAVVLSIVESKFPDLVKIVGGIKYSWEVLFPSKARLNLLGP